MAGLDFTYFLTVAVWGEYGFTDINTDTKKLLPIIRAVQRTRIEPVIGTMLYNKIVTDIKASSVTGLYKEVLEDHIIPTMIAYCDYKATWHTTNQITNKTTGKNSDQNISANDRESNNNLRNELIKDAKQYEKKLKAWLCDHWEQIPELNESPDADEIKQTLPANTDDSHDYFGSISII